MRLVWHTARPRPSGWRNVIAAVVLGRRQYGVNLWFKYRLG